MFIYPCMYMYIPTTVGEHVHDSTLTTARPRGQMSTRPVPRAPQMSTKPVLRVPQMSTDQYPEYPYPADPDRQGGRQCPLGMTLDPSKTLKQKKAAAQPAGQANAPRLRPHLRQDWVPPMPHLRRDWAVAYGQPNWFMKPGMTRWKCRPL
jgi:hypothetical protein